MIDTNRRHRPVRFHHQAALRDLLVWLRDSPDLPDVIAVGHRVVHGGEEYSDPQMLTSEIIARLETFVPLAPLHQPHNLAGIRAIGAVQPDLPQVACFDTAFHFGQPELARLFALPRVYREEGYAAMGSTVCLTNTSPGRWPRPWARWRPGGRWWRILATAPACARCGTAKVWPVPWASPQWRPADGHLQRIAGPRRVALPD